MKLSPRFWIALAAAVGGLFFVSQLVEIPHRSALRGYDNTFNYLWLRSAMVDGDWDFRNDIAECNTLGRDYKEAALALRPTDAGRLPNKYGIGWSVLTLPFYLVADAIVAAGRTLGVWSLERDGFNPVYQLTIQFGHAVLALIGLVLASRVIGRWMNDNRSAALGVIAVWAASPMLYYQTVNLSMTHSAALVMVCLMAWTLERAGAARASQRHRIEAIWWLLTGAALGLATITRFQLAVFGTVVLWVTFREPIARIAAGPTSLQDMPEASGRWSTSIRRLALVALGAAPFLFLQLWAWKVVYGRSLVFTYATEGEAFRWTRPELINSLFSSWHGLFHWHPLMLVALAGTVGWAWVHRGPAIAWCIAIAVTVYINASWWCWWFASSFGNRGYDAALFPLMAGMAWLFLKTKGRWRAVLGVVAIGAATWNAYLVLLYRSGAISRSEPLTWAEMLEAVSRLPEALKF